ncbi:MAG: hypothetical protein ACTSXJ_03255 [Candidatus Baldrarchaeia archaeon]
MQLTVEKAILMIISLSLVSMLCMPIFKSTISVLSNLITDEGTSAGNSSGEGLFRRLDEGIQYVLLTGRPYDSEVYVPSNVNVRVNESTLFVLENSSEGLRIFKKTYPCVISLVPPQGSGTFWLHIEFKEEEKKIYIVFREKE